MNGKEAVKAKNTQAAEVIEMNPIYEQEAR